MTCLLLLKQGGGDPSVDSALSLRVLWEGKECSAHEYYFPRHEHVSIPTVAAFALYKAYSHRQKRV
jgi:hypothetical protein